MAACGALWPRARELLAGAALRGHEANAVALATVVASETKARQWRRALLELLSFHDRGAHGRGI